MRTKLLKSCFKPENVPFIHNDIQDIPSSNTALMTCDY